MKKVLLGIAMLALAGPALADDCRHTASRDARVAAGGITTVAIRVGAGSLTVVGGSGEIRAHGTACASSASILDEIGIETSRRGDRVLIEAKMPTSTSSWFGGITSRLDLRVDVPAGVRVEIADGSGSIEVTGVAAVRIDDGSGEIDVRDVAGIVDIEDGSGSIFVRNVGGPVRIEDGSGSIEIRSVRTDVVIEEDGSGSIEIVGVTGNVTVERDGSGSIDVRDVGGDFRVGRDGSGGISVSGVRGRVETPKH